MRLWQCCGTDGQTGSVSCDNSTDERFDAPGPNFIKTYWPRQNEKKAGKVGPTVGVVIAAVVVLLILSIAVLFLWRRKHRKQERHKVVSNFESLNSRNRFGASSMTKLWRPFPVELQDSTAPVEMDGKNQQEAIELAGTIPWRREMAA